jgi:hypothetical protein
MLWQDGASGYASPVALHPQQGIAVVVLSNQLDRTTLGRLRVLVNGIARVKRRQPRCALELIAARAKNLLNLP